MHKIIFFSRKKICVLTLPKIFRPRYPKHIFFIEIKLKYSLWAYKSTVCLLD